MAYTRTVQTFLLDVLARASGGFVFTAIETTEADALQQFGRALAAYCQEPVPFRFQDWEKAITRLLRIADDGLTVAIIDVSPASEGPPPPSPPSSSGRWTPEHSAPTPRCG